MLSIKDKYMRSGGKRRSITRAREVQEIDFAIYSTDPRIRRALNTVVNAVHVNRGRCSK